MPATTHTCAHCGHACGAEEVVYGELDLGKISHKGTRDVLRQAARNAAHGETVWIVRRDGTRVAAIVSLGRAALCRHMTAASTALGASDEHL
jgi:hypothetical protein